MSADIAEMHRVLAEADMLASPLEVETAVDRIAREVTTELAQTNPLVLVVMNGGVILAGRLLPKLPFPLEFSYIHATRYGQGLTGRELLWKARPTENLRGREILVLDDILDEGYTLAGILDYLKAEGAAAVRLAVLVNKLHDRKAYPGLKPDYCGLEVPDRYVFGCGMDYKGYWRNAPGIYALKGA